MISEQPLVSYLLIVYNQEQFIREALASALAQTYEPLEIVITDDCSPDQTFEIIKNEISEYHGPHTIKLNRNDINLGIARNANRAFEIATGQFFVMAAGDDISVPERTDLLVKRWRDKKEPVDLVCSYFEEIDVNSNSTGFVKKNVVFLPDVKLPVDKWRCGATGACAGFSRRLYDKYGPLDPQVIAEDWIFSFRAWMESGIALIEAPLVKHRTHDGSLSVIYRNINIIKQAESRRLLRQRSIGAELARAKDWLHTCQKPGRALNETIIIEMQRWIRLLEFQCQAYKANRVVALRYAVKSLCQRGGGRGAIKILLRNVLGIK